MAPLAPFSKRVLSRLFQSPSNRLLIMRRIKPPRCQTDVLGLAHVQIPRFGPQTSMRRRGENRKRRGYVRAEGENRRGEERGNACRELAIGTLRLPSLGLDTKAGALDGRFGVPVRMAASSRPRPCRLDEVLKARAPGHGGADVLEHA